MSRKFEFDYDYESDSLFLYSPNNKSKASVELANMIIDFDKNNSISALELLSASQFFKDIKLDGLRMSKRLLREIKSCKIDIVTQRNFFVLKIFLEFDNKKVLATPIFIPSLKESSPALAMA